MLGMQAKITADQQQEQQRHHEAERHGLGDCQQRRRQVEPGHGFRDDPGVRQLQPESGAAEEACELYFGEYTLTVLFIVVVYMFYGLAVVCEEFMVPALSVLCERRRIPPTVSGATLLAAGRGGGEDLQVEERRATLFELEVVRMDPRG